MQLNGAARRAGCYVPKQLIATVVASLILVANSDLNAADWQELEGIYSVTSLNLIDPAIDEITDSHFRIQLKGKSAKDLYHSIKSEPIVDECTGGLARNVGDMQCLFFERDNSFECHFSINVMNQEIDYGVVC